MKRDREMQENQSQLSLGEDMEGFYPPKTFVRTDPADYIKYSVNSLPPATNNPLVLAIYGRSFLDRTEENPTYHLLHSVFGPISRTEILNSIMESLKHEKTYEYFFAVNGDLDECLPLTKFDTPIETIAKELKL